MDGRFSEIELLYIAETLDQHGEYLVDLLVSAIEKKTLISDQEKEHLIERISSKTTKYGINPALIISFPDYGRFIEIKYHQKRQNSAILDEDSVNSTIWGIRKRKKLIKKKKDTRWYAKNAYGSLNRLIGILMYEFTDAERERLSRLIENKQQMS